MSTIKGILVWDTTVPDHHGWLLYSDALLEGAACIPAPEADAQEDATPDELQALVVVTLRWEGYRSVEDVTLSPADEGYTWTADTHDEDE
jgi:hypothetical protein